MAEGTVLMRVTSRAAGRPGNPSAFSAMMTLPPLLSGTNISKIDKSKQTEVEASTPHSSSAVKASRAQETKATAQRCSRATPLGLPVEPDVYMTYAKEDGCVSFAGVSTGFVKVSAKTS